MKRGLLVLLSFLVSNSWGDRHAGWKEYGGGPENIRYSALDQVDRSNVARLRVAWTFDTGDAFSGSELQCNPIVVDGALYATTPKARVIALDAATGRPRWSFDPGLSLGKFRNRGVTYWASGRDRRIFVAVREYLYALNADDGKPVAAFGENGRVDLRQGLGREPGGFNISATTPGVVYKDLLILGSITGEDLPAAPGDIRAFDVRTGRQRWSFHTIPHPGEIGYDTWPRDAWKTSGGANAWSGLSLDAGRGLVFAATGSAAFDFYGADRAGDNLFANCVLALKADTGERVWHFQTVRHDVWDRDLPAAPSLVTVRHDGRTVDAVAQITKSGYVFLFERATGRPLFPIEQRKVANDGVDGETLAPTQPLPLQPPPFARQSLTAEDVTTRTPEARASVLHRLRRLRSAGQFTPPSREGTVIFPGFDGGGEWGGGAFDPDTGLFYVNANEMAWVLRLVERPKFKPAAGGRDLYLRHCASCHHANLTGTPPDFPALINIGRKFTQDQLVEITRAGRGRMPAFAFLHNAGLRAIARYLSSGEDTAPAAAAAETMPQLKYTHDGYNKFLDPDGYPAVAPPWGTLNAIDLNKGEIAWKIPFGDFPELAAQGLRDTGSENYGGPLVTAGGLLFIAATNHDRKFRAFDKATGKLLWETKLPFAGNATPATYEVNGRQYIVIAAGGGKSGAPSGGTYVAFALQNP